MGHRTAWIVLAFLISATLAVAPARAGAPSDGVLLSQAQVNLEQGNDEEALEILTRSWQQGPRTPEKALLLGVACRRLLNYPQARQYLEEALRLKPGFPEAQRLLADTLIALDRPEQALPHLQELERSGYQPAQTAYLLGTANSKLRRYPEAVGYFRKAQEDPGLAQDAKFQMSLALAAANRPREAKAALQEAIALAPQSDTGGLAQRYAAALERRGPETRPFRFFGSVGFDYDSNVTLQPGGAAGAQLISGKADWVFTYNAVLEYAFFAGSPFSLLAQYAATENFHPKLTNFDSVSHAVALAPTYQCGPNSKFYMPLTYNYVDVGYDKYYTGYIASPTYFYLPDPRIGLETGLRGAKNDYWTPGIIPQDNRSGYTGGGSLGVYYFLKQRPGYLQARFSYEHDWAHGSNWRSNAYRLFLLGLYPVTPRLKVSALVDVILQPYDDGFKNATTGNIASPREDRILITGVNATYNISRGLEFNAHYYFVRDCSNTPLYNYVRHIGGCQLGYRY